MQLVCKVDAVCIEHSHANAAPSAPASAGPIERSVWIRKRSLDLRFRINRRAAPPKRLTPSTPTTPENDDKADARRRPPTITLPSLNAWASCRGTRSCPFVAKVPFQVGPRFVKRKHSYDSFHGTSPIHESFSCKLVVTYRVLRMTRSHRGYSLDHNETRFASRESQSLFQSVATYRSIK